jgi:hypothetical protein
MQTRLTTKVTKDTKDTKDTKCPSKNGFVAFGCFVVNVLGGRAHGD